jgi:uncharacterized membrane protein
MNSSWVASVNARGALAGISDNDTIDPLTGYAEADAVLWKDGQIVNLGTLGGNESVALWINDRDEVVGAAANTVADSASLWGRGRPGPVARRRITSDAHRLVTPAHHGRDRQRSAPAAQRVQDDPRC